MHFIWLIFFNFQNITYLFLSMSVICARGNKAVINSGCTYVCFTLNGPLKMFLSRFRCVHRFNFKINFDKKFMKKLPFIFYVFPNFYSVAKYYVLLTVDSKMVVPWIISEFWKQIFFVWLVYLKWRHKIYLLFVVSWICTNGYFMLTNQSYMS